MTRATSQKWEAVSEIFSEPKSQIGRQLILGDAAEAGVARFGAVQTGPSESPSTDVRPSEPVVIQSGPGLQGAGEYHARGDARLM